MCVFPVSKEDELLSWLTFFLVDQLYLPFAFPMRSFHKKYRGGQWNIDKTEKVSDHRLLMKNLKLPFSLLFSLFFAPSFILGMTYTWLGPGSDLNTAAIWGGKIPGPNDIGQFTGNLPNIISQSGPFSIAEIDFTTSALYTIYNNSNADLTITGNNGGVGVRNTVAAPVFQSLTPSSRIVFSGGSADSERSGLVAYKLTNGAMVFQSYSDGGAAFTQLNSGSTLQINTPSPIHMGMVETLDENSKIQLTSGGLIFGGSDVCSPGTSLIQGQIFGPGSIAVNLNPDFFPVNGIALTNNTNSYAGGTTLTQGILNIANGSCLGTGAVTFQGGTLQLASSSASNLTQNISVPSSGTIDLNGTTGWGLQSTSSVSGAGSLSIGSTSGLGIFHYNPYSSSLSQFKISDATIVVTNPAILPSNIAFVSGSSVLEIDFNGSKSVSNTISGPGSLIVNKNSATTGALTLTGSLSYGMTNVQGGSVIFATDVSNLTGPIALYGSANADFEVTGISTFSQNITGSGAVYLNKNGSSGTLFLSSSGSNYSGGTSLFKGVLAISEGSQIGTGPLTFNGGHLKFVSNGGTLSTPLILTNHGTIDLNGQTWNLSSPLSGGNTTLNITSSTSTGTLVFYPSSITWGGTLSLDAGSSVVFSANPNIPNGTLALNGGTLKFGSNSQNLAIKTHILANSSIDLLGTSGWTMTSPLSGSSSSALTFLSSSGNGSLIFSPTMNHWNGPIKISPSTTVIASNGANLSGGVDLNSGTLEFSTSTNQTISGAITGTGTLNINANFADTGVVTLSGNNTFDGTTNLAHGSLVIENAPEFKSTIALASGTSLDIEVKKTATFSANITGEGSLMVNENGPVQPPAIAQNTQPMPAMGMGNSGFGANSFGGSSSSNLASKFPPMPQMSGMGNGMNPAVAVATAPVAAPPTQILTLTGTNTYSGGTTLFAGTLAIGSSHNIGPGAITFDGGKLQLNDFLTLAQNLEVDSVGTIDAGTFGVELQGNLSGDPTGLLTLKNGNSLSSLTGTNNGWEGTLELSNISVAVTNGVQLPANLIIDTDATLRVDASSGTQIHTLISGSGNVEINFSGNAANHSFSGAHTLKGLTTVHCGGVEYTGDLSQMTGEINLKSGALANFESPNSYSGIISGTGQVFINQSGSLENVTLGGANTYSGATTIVNGSLTLTGDVSLLKGPLHIGSQTLIVSSSGTLGALFDGNGNFIRNGVGTLSLPHKYEGFTGQTSITGGNLSVDGVLGGHVDVSHGGVLSGTGEILGNIVVNGGTVAPGNSIGTLTLDGSYEQKDGGNFLVQVDHAGASSRLTVGGSAKLGEGSILTVQPTDGVLLGKKYQFMHASAGIENAFSTVHFPSPIVSTDVSYHGNDALLELNLNLLSFAKTSNQKEIAKQIQTRQRDIDPLVQALISLPGDQVLHTLNALSGTPYTTLLLTSEWASQRFLAELFNPIRRIFARESDCYEACPEVWIEGGGGRVHANGNHHIPEFSTNHGEISLGAQMPFGPCWTFGLAGSYEYDDVKFHFGGNNQRNDYMGALYAVFRPAGWYAYSDLILGYSDEEVKRHVHASKFQGSVKSNPNVFKTTFYVEGGYDFDLASILYSLTDLEIPGILAQPFVGLETGYYSFNRFAEKGDDLIRLSHKQKSITNVYGDFGFHATTVLPLLDCYWTIGLDALAHCRLTNDNHNCHQRFESFGSPYTVKGLQMSRFSGEADIYLSADALDGYDIYLQLTGRWWSNVSSYNAILGIATSW
jgi:autotransporter-associated beta strand protein